MTFLIMIGLTTHQWLAPFVVSKIGPKKALVIGATIMLLRILLAAIFTDPYIISCVKMFHALEVGYQNVFYTISTVVSIMVIFRTVLLSRKIQRIP